MTTSIAQNVSAHLGETVKALLNFPNILVTRDGLEIIADPATDLYRIECQDGACSKITKTDLANLAPALAKARDFHL